MLLILAVSCCYDKILELLNQSEVKRLFNPENDIQKLGRILLMSDSATL